MADNVDLLYTNVPVNVGDEKCFATLKVHSNFLIQDGNFIFFDFVLPRVMVQLVLIFVLTQSLHFLLRRIHLPRLVSELLVGISLGPSGLGQIPIIRDTLLQKVAAEQHVYLDLLSKIGYIFFIFLCGVKMNPRTLLKTGTKPWILGLATVIIPSTISMNTILKSNMSNYTQKYKVPSFRNVMLVQNMFSFPVIYSMLVDLKMSNSDLGRFALSSALISDLASNAIFIAISHGRISHMGFSRSISIQSSFFTISLVFFIILVGRPIFRWIIRNTPEGKPVSRSHVKLMAILLLVVFLITDNVGLHYMYGPFILGLVVPDGPPLGATLVDEFETLTSGLFAPLLVTYCGMQVNLLELYDLNFIIFVWINLVIIVLLKLVSTFIWSLFCHLSFAKALALALIMASQGVVHMSFYYQDLVNQVFGVETFSILMVSFLVQAVISHPLVSWLHNHSTKNYGNVKKRDIQHVPLNSELRVLTCAHRLDDVLSIRKILETSFSTIENQLTVFAVHLVELAGRAHPQLIDHKLDEKPPSEGRTRKMINAFSSFKQEYEGFVTVEQFTSISLPKFMHHDICSLALNKLASLIILPFHRKWNHQGKLVLDSSIIRAINYDVLESAPCSVAIFIDRQKMPRPVAPMYNLGVPFFGGSDDREALAFALRLSQSEGIRVLVVRFVPWNVGWGETQWDTLLDAKMLKESQTIDTENLRVVYKEERVKDGAESALTLHNMEDV